MFVYMYHHFELQFHVSRDHTGNAIKNAETPVMDALAEVESRGEYTTLDASGLAVGIPAGVMGNSEVGHFTIGTGRVVYQVSGRETFLLTAMYIHIYVYVNSVRDVHVCV